MVRTVTHEPVADFCCTVSGIGPLQVLEASIKASVSNTTSAGTSADTGVIELSDEGDDPESEQPASTNNATTATGVVTLMIQRTRTLCPKWTPLSSDRIPAPWSQQSTALSPVLAVGHASAGELSVTQSMMPNQLTMSFSTP